MKPELQQKLFLKIEAITSLLVGFKNCQNDNENETNAKNIDIMIKELLTGNELTDNELGELKAILKASIVKILGNDEKFSYLMNKTEFVSKNLFGMYNRRGFLKLLGFSAGAIVASNFVFPKTAFGYVVKQFIDKSLIKKECYVDRRIKEHKFIIYHQTAGYESGARESLKWNDRRGGAHYLIHLNGKIEQLVPDEFVAKHVGNSIWIDKGKKYESLNNWAIGIENIDNNEGKLTAEQYASLKGLIKQLQKKYHIPDDCVLPHGLVRKEKMYIKSAGKKIWVRGGKPCGMKFSRAKDGGLDLGKLPKDKCIGKDLGKNTLIEKYVKLINKDIKKNVSPVQKQAIYADLTKITKDVSAWMIAGNEYNSNSTIYLLPPPDNRIFAGSEISDFGVLPPNTRVFTDSTKKRVTKYVVPSQIEVVLKENVACVANSEKTCVSTEIVVNDDTPTLWSLLGKEVLSSSTTVFYNPFDKKIFVGSDVKNWDKIVIPSGMRIFVNSSKDFVLKSVVSPLIVYDGSTTPFSLLGARALHDCTAYLLKRSPDAVFELKSDIVLGSQIRNEKFYEGTKIITNVIGGPFLISEHSIYSQVKNDYNNKKIVCVFPDGSVKFGDEIDVASLSGEVCFFVREFA